MGCCCCRTSPMHSSKKEIIFTLLVSISLDTLEVGLVKCMPLLLMSSTALFYETFLFPPSLMAPFRAGSHQITCIWLTPTYTCLLLIVTDLFLLCPSTVLLEMSPLVYSCKIRSFILQVFKFHALSRRENGWKERGTSYFILTIAGFPVQRCLVHFRWVWQEPDQKRCRSWAHFPDGPCSSPLEDQPGPALAA